MTDTQKRHGTWALVYLLWLLALWVTCAPLAGAQTPGCATTPVADSTIADSAGIRVEVLYGERVPGQWCPTGFVRMTYPADTGRVLRAALTGRVTALNSRTFDGLDSAQFIDALRTAYPTWRVMRADVIERYMAEGTVLPPPVVVPPPPVVIDPPPLPPPTTTAQDCALVGPQVGSVTQGVGYVLKGDGRFEVWVGPVCRGVITMRSATRYTATVWSCETGTWVARTTSYLSRTSAAKAVLGQGTCP